MTGPEMMSMNMSHRIALLIGSVAILLLILELVRRGMLKERYALLWLATALLGLIVGVLPYTIVVLAHWFHVQYLTVLFMGFFVFILGIVLSFSVVISRLHEHNRELAQEVALLDQKVRAIEGRRNE